MAKSFAAVLGRQMRTSVGKADSRKRLIGAVRAAASRMGISDDDRKAIQLEVTGKASMADMSLGEIGKVLDRLNRDRPAPSGHRAHIGKIRALWWSLYWLGEIREPNDAALDKFVRRQTGIASLKFVDYRSAPAIIEALKSMCVRAGVQWSDAATTAEIALTVPEFNAALHDRHRVIAAIWSKLLERGVVRAFTHHEFLQRGLGLCLSHWCWTDRELDAAIKALGKMLHRAIAKEDGAA